MRAYGKVFGEENKNQFSCENGSRAGSQSHVSSGAMCVGVPIPFVNHKPVINQLAFLELQKSFSFSFGDSTSSEKTRELCSLMSRCMTRFAY